ncbi:MAG: ferritin-like domain-containing protein [Alphaproteobacteria bacterium]|nr:ferritin-like domain-containing protein [Alphaproteobacteria bacterium]
MISSIHASSLGDAAVRVLGTADARQKACVAREVAKTWLGRRYDIVGVTGAVPDRPARPDRPVLMLPRDVPRRKINAGAAGRIALLHALAHIELNAIDLAFDIIARFSHQDLPDEFFDDWIAVGDDEARHFLMLEDRLQELGGAYGDLPAHDGLWQAAMETAHDVLARLAIVPMVLEARGLDVTPDMIRRLEIAGDQESAAALTIIHDDEIGHVAVGKRWFDHVCAMRDLSDPVAVWQDLVRKHFKGGLKPPFNTASRDLAGFPEQYYAIFDA